MVVSTHIHIAQKRDPCILVVHTENKPSRLQCPHAHPNLPPHTLPECIYFSTSREGSKWVIPTLQKKPSCFLRFSSIASYLNSKWVIPTLKKKAILLSEVFINSILSEFKMGNSHTSKKSSCFLRFSSIASYLNSKWVIPTLQKSHPAF